MRKFRVIPRIVEAVQITESTFTDPHPNLEHVEGLIYNPVDKVVTLPNRRENGITTYVAIGDWILRDADGDFEVVSDEYFKKNFEDPNKLHLAGNATDHVWAMVDEREPNSIGLRLDSGDSGVVYFTPYQASLAADSLMRMAYPSSQPDAVKGE